MRAEVDVAHDGELLQILRLGIDVRADVDEDGRRALRGGKNRGQRGTINARDRAQHHLGGGHGRAGIAGGDKSVGLAVAHQAKAHAHRGVALGAHRLRRLLLHADDFAGIDDADGKPAPEAMQIELGADDFFFAHQHDFHVVVTCGEDGAFDFGFGRAVSAHGVKSNDGWHACLSVANLVDRGARSSPASSRDCARARPQSAESLGHGSRPSWSLSSTSMTSRPL